MSVNALVLEGLRTSCKQNVSGGWVQKSYELAGLRTTHHAKDTANTRLSCRNAAKRRFWGHTMGGGSEPRAGIIYDDYMYKYIFTCKGGWFASGASFMMFLQIHPGLGLFINGEDSRNRLDTRTIS